MKKVKVLDNQNKICNEIVRYGMYENQKDDFSIRIVFAGGEHYTIQNKKLTVYPGSFLVINRDTIFNREIFSNEPANTFSISYSDEFLSVFEKDHTYPDLKLLDEPFNNDVKGTRRFMETIYPFSGDMMFNLMHLKAHFDGLMHNDMLINEYLYYCLLNFYELYESEIIAKSTQLKLLDKSARIELFKRLNNAKDYMRSNYSRTLTNQEISKHACLSEIHFYRTFKQVYNCSPHQYLIQLRLVHASLLLKTTEYTIAEIVNLVGLDSISSFICLFRERFGFTPGKFRDYALAG